MATDNSKKKRISRVIAIVNQKGGTGKTTVSVNLSVGLARRKFKTFLIDLDPQHNSTLSLGVDTLTLPLSIYDVLLKEAPLSREFYQASCGVEGILGRKGLRVVATV